MIETRCSFGTLSTRSADVGQRRYRVSRLQRMVLCISFASMAVAAGADETWNNDAVITMVKAGIGDDTIVSLIDTQHGSYRITSTELVRLKDAGASNAIIN